MEPAGARVTASALGLACLACLLLALSLRRHYRQVFADEAAYPRRLWLLRWSGYGCMALALWPCTRELGLWIGIVLWLSLLALAAFLQILLLTYRPRGSLAFGACGVALLALGLLL